MKKKDLLDNWLNGELTPEEFEVFRTIPEFSSYLKINTFVKGINLPVHDTKTALQELKEGRDNSEKIKNPKIISLSAIAKIAALLTIMLASYYFISNLDTTQRTEFAEIEHMSLPDNSKVTLNGASEVKFRKNSWDKNRTITLSGEAFFEVAKGSRFTVETRQGSVVVLGTKFNVISRDDLFTVACFEGLVRVTQNDVSIELHPGKTVTLEGDDLEITTVYTTRPAWIYNESSFDDIAITDVITVLEKQYRMTVTTENIDVNLRFTGSFPNDDLEAALQAVTLPLNLNYTLDNKDAVTIFDAIIPE